MCAADAIETEIMGTKTVVGVKRSRELDLDESEVDTVAEAMLDLVPKPQVSEGDDLGAPDGTTVVNGDTPNTSSKKSKKKKKSKVCWNGLICVYKALTDTAGSLCRVPSRKKTKKLRH